MNKKEGFSEGYEHQMALTTKHSFPCSVREKVCELLSSIRPYIQVRNYYHCSPGVGRLQVHGFTKKRNVRSEWSQEETQLGAQTSWKAELHGELRLSGQGRAWATGRVFGSKSPQMVKSMFVLKVTIPPLEGRAPLEQGVALEPSMATH